MRILALSDVADERAYASVRSSVGRVDLIWGCGDLPYDYLDYVATELGVPLFAVHGNHDTLPEALEDPAIGTWWRGINIHGRVIGVDGLLVAGLGGSRRYNDGPYQLSETEMWFTILRMLPALVVNRLLRRRSPRRARHAFAASSERARFHTRTPLPAGTTASISQRSRRSAAPMRCEISPTILRPISTCGSPNTTGTCMRPASRRATACPAWSMNTSRITASSR